MQCVRKKNIWTWSTKLLAWFSDVRGRSRSLTLPSLSRLIYSVRSRVRDVRVIVDFHQSERVYHISRSVECMECNFPHIESNQNGGDVEGFDSAVQNWFVYFSMPHFLHALWLAFHTQKGTLTSWTRLRTEYIGREREGSERDRERPRTSENQAIHGALNPWNPYIKIEI